MPTFIHFIIRLMSQLLTKNKLNILIYHQVLSKSDPMRPSEPTVDVFQWQMKLINKYFTPLSISTALKHLESDTLPANAICITFDDGYLNNLTVAAPILKQFNIPATVYIATGFSDGENMFNDRVIDLMANEALSVLSLNALAEQPIELDSTEKRIKTAHHIISKIKYLPVNERKKLIDILYQENTTTEFPSKMMTVEQLKQLDATGIEIGAHTVEHPILRVLEPAEQKQQIAKSKEALELLLEKKIIGFAYPNGKVMDDYDMTTAKIVEELGFDYAVSTNWGITAKNSDKYQLSRFTPWDTTPMKFHLRLFLHSLKSHG